MRFSVLVVGGLGHVGSAVLSELSSLPIVGSVAVASRNPISKCNPVEVLDITESSLEATVEVFRKYDLVVDCAGPSAILGEPISNAAAIAGVPLVTRRALPAAPMSKSTGVERFRERSPQLSS
mgnify:CR=1 FL=1